MKIIIFILVLLCSLSFSDLRAEQDLFQFSGYAIKKLRLQNVSFLKKRELIKLFESQPKSKIQFWKKDTLFSESTFNSDIKRLKRHFEQKGYYHTDIKHTLKTPKDKQLVIEISIQKNTPIHIHSLRIELESDNQTLKTALLAEEGFKEGDIFDEEDYLNYASKLKNIMMNQGYFKSTVEKKALLSKSKKQVNIVYTCIPGPLGRFAISEIHGLNKLSSSIVSREIRWKKGELFSLEPLTETRRQLQRTDLFDFIQFKVDPLPEHPNLLKIRIQLEEAKARRLRTTIGYASDVGPRAGIMWEHKNLFQRGHRFMSRIEGSPLGLRFQSDYEIPYFLKPQQTYQAQFYQVIDDEDLYELHSSELHQTIERENKFGLRYGFDYALAFQYYDQVPSNYPPYISSIKTQGLISGPGFHWQKQSLDDLLFPSKGYDLHLGLESSLKPLGGSYEYWKSTWTFKKFTPLWNDIVLAKMIKLGFSDAIGEEKNMPLSKRFFAGGDIHGRGYRRRSLGPTSAQGDIIGGKSHIMSSIECRKKVWRELAAHLFYDFSQLSTKPHAFHQANIDQSFGFGFGYRSSLGLLRFDCGFPLKKDPRHDSFRIHFGIGYAI